MSDFALKVIRAIPGNGNRKDPDNKWGESGTLDFKCERCGKAIIWGRVRSNGHIRAFCSIPDCFRMMS